MIFSASNEGCKKLNKIVLCYKNDKSKNSFCYRNMYKEPLTRTCEFREELMEEKRKRHFSNRKKFIKCHRRKNWPLKELNRFLGAL